MLVGEIQWRASGCVGGDSDRIVSEGYFMGGNRSLWGAVVREVRVRACCGEGSKSEDVLR